ncbi:hypothetical protein NN561_012091 [Cricetulus griseus]
MRPGLRGAQSSGVLGDRLLLCGPLPTSSHESGSHGPAERCDDGSRLAGPAHLPLPHRNTKGLGHLAGDFLAAQPSPRACRLPLPAAHDPLRAPSSGGAGVSPPLLRFLKCLKIQKRFRNAFRLREREDLG